MQIDATNLSYPYLNLDNVAQDKTKPIQARLLPGSHHLQANGALLWFSVGNDGNISYDASLEGIFTGRGTEDTKIHRIVGELKSHGLSGSPVAASAKEETRSKKKAGQTRYLPDPLSSRSSKWSQGPQLLDFSRNLAFRDFTAQGEEQFLSARNRGFTRTDHRVYSSSELQIYNRRISAGRNFDEVSPGSYRARRPTLVPAGIAQRSLGGIAGNRGLL